MSKIRVATDSHIRQVMATRLTQSREKAGYRSRTEACRVFGFNVNTCKAHEYGQRKFNVEDAARYAEAYHVSAPFLLAEDTGGTLDEEFLIDEIHDGAHHQASPDADTPRPSKLPLPDTPDFKGFFKTFLLPEMLAGTEPGEMVRDDMTVPPFPSGGAHHAAPPDKAHAGEFHVPITLLSARGAIAHGVWLSGESFALFDLVARVPVATGHPAIGQFARHVIGPSASGRFSAGDFVIFIPVSDRTLPPGIVSVVRRKGKLVESALWHSDGRTMTSDNASLSIQETLFHDPDDETIHIEGLAVAVYRPL